MISVAIYTHDAARAHDTGSHPERIERYTVAREALEAHDILRDRAEWREAPEVTDAQALACHTAAHLARVRSIAGERGALDPDTVYSEGTLPAVLRAAGGAARAAEACWKGEVPAAFSLARPPGHHATPDRAMGFCFLNNIAIAARHLRSLGCERVLIVDWDVHHGNGTQDIFWDDPSVFFYSLHESPLYPGTGAADETGGDGAEGTTLNRPLPAGFPAERYRELFRADLDRIRAEFDPSFVLISAGFDSHIDDPLGSLTLRERDFAHLTEAVLERMPPGRVAAALEGGYNLPALARSAVACVEALAGVH